MPHPNLANNNPELKRRIAFSRPVRPWIMLHVVICLSNLVVMAVLSSFLSKASLLAGALMEGFLVALVSSPFLWRLIITPFREGERREVNKFRMVIDAAPEGIFEVTAEGRIQSANAEAARLFGYSRNELIGEEIEILIPHQLRGRHVQKRGQYVAEPHTRPMGTGLELVGRKKNGEEFPVEISLSMLAEPEAPCVICVVRDVSPQRASKKEIVQINERLQDSLTANRTLSETLGHLSQFGELLQSCSTLSESYPIVTKMCERLFPEHSGAVLLVTSSRNALERVAAWGQFRPLKPVVAIHECWALRRGKLHASDLTPCGGCKSSSDDVRDAVTVCVPMVAQGDMLGVLHLSALPSLTEAHAISSASLPVCDTGVVEAVAERISLAIANLRLRETLRGQAIRDVLTGLFNRRFLEEYLELELLRAMRSGRPLTVMMLDVDHFKRFNDTFGHNAGDLVLREIAGILRTRTRGSDMACRFGGEELVVVGPETSLEHGLQRAEQICQAIANLTVIYEGQPLGKVTISVGVASAPEHGYDMAELLRAADEALYAAKKAGRNRVFHVPALQSLSH